MLGLALELVHASVAVGDRRRRRRAGRLVDITAPRRGRGLDAGGGVDAIADDQSFLSRGRGRAAGHHSDAGLKPGPVLGAVGGDGGDELEAGADGTLRVVLLRDRGSPHGHDRIADELLDRPAVPRHDRPGELEVAGEELAHLLGVAFFGKGRESDQVAKKDRDMPELVSARRQWPRKPRAASGGTGQRRPALVAELRGRQHRGATARTGAGKRAAALVAELAACRVLDPAARAVQLSPPPLAERLRRPPVHPASYFPGGCHQTRLGTPATHPSRPGRSRAR